MQLYIFKWKTIYKISKNFSSNRSDKEAWKNFLFDINEEENNKDIKLIVEQKLINKSNVEITLDIIDFICIYGSMKIVELIA